MVSSGITLVNITLSGQNVFITDLLEGSSFDGDKVIGVKELSISESKVVYVIFIWCGREREGISSVKNGFDCVGLPIEEPLGTYLVGNVRYVSVSVIKANISRIGVTV